MYRTLKNALLQGIDSRDVLILLGPRQVGKTTILKNLFSDTAIYIDLDDKIYRDFFDSLSLAKYKSYVDSHLGAMQHEKKKVILILDEAQRLKDPGLAAKLFYDEIPDVKVILTGSATLDIKKKTAESLAGRKTTFHLFPLSFQEFLIQKGIVSETIADDFSLPHSIEYDEIKMNSINEAMYERMRVGLYPGVLQTQAERYLHELVEAVILKDIFYLNLVKNTEGLIDLLKLLAASIGEDINVLEISKRLGIARQTINDYISILERSYIIFQLHPFKKERPDEITKATKIYFYDLGIRNALINDFRPITGRLDMEKLFKNFVITEMYKLNSYYNLRYSFHYWRTTQGSEVDLILTKDDEIKAISIDPFKERFSKGFENTYPESQKYTLTFNNYSHFII